MAKKGKKDFKEVTVGGEPAFSEYARARWKHYTRWLVFSFVAFLYITLILNSYHSHILLHKGFIIQELIVYLLCSIMLIPILPSVVFEVDYVKVTKEDIEFSNLLFRKKVKWDEIRKFKDPKYLKFAIVWTDRFIYLINKRDISNFGELAETILENAVKLPK